MEIEAERLRSGGRGGVTGAEKPDAGVRQGGRPARKAMKRGIVYIIGPSTRTRGGIGYVIGTHSKSGLSDSHELIHIVTQQDGGALIKALLYAQALFRFAFLRLTRGRGLVHIHSSIGSSFYLKEVLLYLLRW